MKQKKKRKDKNTYPEIIDLKENNLFFWNLQEKLKWISVIWLKLTDIKPQTLLLRKVPTPFYTTRIFNYLGLPKISSQHF